MYGGFGIVSKRKPKPMGIKGRKRKKNGRCITITLSLEEKKKYLKGESEFRKAEKYIENNNGTIALKELDRTEREEIKELEIDQQMWVGGSKFGNFNRYSTSFQLFDYRTPPKTRGLREVKIKRIKTWSKEFNMINSKGE